MQDIKALKAQVYDSSAYVDLVGPPFPGGAIETSFRTVRLYGGLQTLYAATADYTTQPTDTPANQWMPGLIVEAFNYQLRLFSGLEPGGASAPGFGEIVLNDADDELASWLDYGWDSRLLELYRGDDRAAWSAFTRVAKVTCDGIEWDGRQRRIRLRNLDWMLHRPLQTRFYDGSGGRGGGSDVSGQPVPHLYGYGWNIAPKLFDAANRVYQYHAGAALGVTAARDGGSPLTIVGTAPTYETLIAMSLSIGEVAHCPAEGMIRCGGAMARGLTIDAVGQRKPSTIPTLTAADIVRWIVTQGPAGAWFPDPAGLDTAAFTQLDTDEPGFLGIYLPEQVDVAEVLDRLMAGVEGWWTVRLDGTFTCGTWKEPDVSADYSFDYPSDILTEPTVESLVPRVATAIGWKRLEQVQAGGDLADGASEADRALYGNQYRYATAGSSTTAAKYPSNRRVLIPGNYASESDALTRANTSQALYGVPCETVTLGLRCDPFLALAGKTVEIRNHPRWGSSALFRCQGIEAVDSRGTVTVRLWRLA